jgi:head-tail adaptor
VGKHEYGDKEDESSTERVWVAGYHHVTARSRLTYVLELMNSLLL